MCHAQFAMILLPALVVSAAILMPLTAPVSGVKAAAAAQDAASVEALGLDRPTRRLVQRGLRSEGFDPGAPDRLFGPRTRAAVRAWQAAPHEPQTGYVRGGQAEAPSAAGAPPALTQGQALSARAIASGIIPASSRADAGAVQLTNSPDPSKADAPSLSDAVASTPTIAVASAAPVRAGAPLPASHEGVGNFLPAATAEAASPQAAAAPAQLPSDTLLPPEIQMDRYLIQAEERIRRQNFFGAKEALDRILELQGRGLEIPAVIHFRHAEVSARAGLHQEAIDSVTRYLNLTGRDGHHYRDALRLLNSAEEAEAARIAAEEVRWRARAAIHDAIAGMEFVRIPAGEFPMGSTSSEAEPHEQPVTRVRISRPFDLGKYEVTQLEWWAVMGAQRQTDSYPYCGDCPVGKVTWNDVQAFIEKLDAADRAATYRLPTEAEWEYAARAGTTDERYSEDLDAIAWHSEVGAPHRLRPVGGKLPNAFGLHDMLGNAAEWAQDSTDVGAGHPGGAVMDPLRSSGETRVVRGECVSGPENCRISARRTDLTPDSWREWLGFRLLREVPRPFGICQGWDLRSRASGPTTSPGVCRACPQPGCSP